MKNRIFAIILACLTLVSSLYIPSFAAEETEANDFTSTISEVVEGCSHANGTLVKYLKESDCQTGTIGIAKYHCDDCDSDYYKQLPLHTGDWLELVKPTCGTPGKKIQYCATCDKTFGEEVVVPATGKHTLNEKETIVDPTCTEYGYAIYECSVCGYADETTKTVIEDLAPLNHPETYTKEIGATCASNAMVITYCELCDVKVDEEDLYLASVAAGAEDLSLKAKEHADTKLVSNGDKTHNVVCVDCGTVIEENVECVYTKDTTPATCNTYAVDVYTCTCDHSYSEVREDLGFDTTKHDFDVKAIKKATCTANGIGKQVCSVCGATGVYQIIPMGHDWGEPYDVTPATCETAGKATHKCGICNTVVTYDIPALGHKYEMVTTKQPTCGATGLAVEMCINCNTVKEDGATEVLPIQGEHVWATEETHSDPDCLNPGKVWIACTVCEAVKEDSLKDIEGAPALGHKPDSKVHPADCTNNAEEITFCTRCNVVLETHDLFEELGGEGEADPSLKAFGHTAGSPVSDKNGKHTVSCLTCGEKLSEADCDYTEEKVSDATCQKKQVNKYTCEECNHTYNKEVGELATDNHVWGKDKVIKEVTCTTNGIAKKVCACGAVGDYYVISASHTWGDPVYSVEPTCDTAGKATHVCKVCGEIEENYVVDALGHKTEVVVTKQPTCGVAGSKIEMCLVCEKTFGEAEAIEATGEHVWATVETVVDATCTTPTKVYIACTVCDAEKPGSVETVGEALGHTEVSKHYEADCDEPEREVIYCTVCDVVIEEVDLSQELGEDGNPVGSAALGHNYGDPVFVPGGTHAATCSRCGHVDENVCSWTVIEIIDATCQSVAYRKSQCTVCKKVVTNPIKNSTIDPDNHVGGADKIIKAPTCTTNGIKKEVCVCGVIGGYYLVPATHNWDVTNVTKEATCDEAGAGTHTCKDCGITENVEIPALGHTTEMVVTKQPTCGVAGSKISTCLTCGETFGDAVTIPATGKHEWLAEQTEDATCDKPAKVYTVCTVCKAEKDVVTVGTALGHVDANGPEYREPTCVKGALEVSVCDRCKTEFNVVELDKVLGEDGEPVGAPALGHKYGDYVSDGKGKHTRTCSVCKEKETKDCVYGAVVTTVATCQKKEVTTYTCEDCEHSYTKETAEKNPLNHEWTESVVKAPTCTTSGIGKYVCACDSKINNGYYLIRPTHTWELTNVSKEATCTDDGAGTQTCKVCGVSEDIVIPAKGHDMEFTVVTEPTCGVAGKKTEYCKVCNAEGESKEIPATGDHKWALDEKIDEATCQANAFVYVPCTVCGAAKDGVKYEVAGSKLEHTEDVKDYPADCENNARTVISCAVCNEIIQTIDLYVGSIDPETGKGDETLKAFGHDWSDYVTAEGKHSRVCATCNKVDAAECSYVAKSVAATCQKGAYTVYTCSVCSDSYESEAGETLDKNNHDYAEVIIKDNVDCNTSGIAKLACACGDVKEYYVIPAGHNWNETEHVSEISETVYKLCDDCGAALIVAYFGEQNFEDGQIVDHLAFDSEITVTPSIDTHITLTISVKADLSFYHAEWIVVRVGGVEEKITDFRIENGMYTFKYTTGVNAIDETFEIRLFAEIADILCVGDTETFTFDRVSEAPVVEAIATDKIANATAFFVGRGVSIDEEVHLVYRISTSLPEGARLVLKNKDDGRIYEDLLIADLDIVNGVYVADVAVAGADWDQYYAATICDAEGNALSNTNYYSIAQFAALKIVADDTNELSNTLRAMMAYTAE